MSEMQTTVAIVIIQVVAVDEKNKNKKKLALKIILPVLVVVIIAGIWFYKTNETSQETANSGSSVTTPDKSQAITDSSSSVNTTDETQESADSSSSINITDESQETSEISSSKTTAVETQEKADINFLLAASEIDLEKLKSYGLPIIIDFGADECIPCKEMAPVLKKLNQEWQDKVIVKFVDVWKYPNAAAEFPVQLIPTQFFFDAKGNPYVPSDPEGMQMIMYSLKDTQEHVYTAHQGGLTEEQFRTIFKEMGIK